MKKLLATVLLGALSIQAFAKPLVVYSGRAESLVGPIFEKFEKDTGIKLDVRYNSSPQLATQLLNEGARTPADVAFFQETGYLTVLGEAGLLRSLSEEIVEQVDEPYRQKDNYWVGTSARARVIAYNPEKIKPEELPKTLNELSDPKWKNRFGWAPPNASFQAHISALRKLWGPEKTEAFLEELIALNPKAYPKNSTLVSAVNAEEVDIAWTNHYYLYNLRKQNPHFKVANYTFPGTGNGGNILMMVGAGVLKSSKQPKEAEMLVNYLLSEETQAMFTNDVFEYPTRKGMKPSSELPELTDIEFVEIDQADLADVGPTLELLKKYGLL